MSPNFVFGTEPSMMKLPDAWLRNTFDRISDEVVLRQVMGWQLVFIAVFHWPMGIERED